MNELESKDIVGRLLEEDGKLHIAFRAHAGIYTVPLSNANLCAAIREAQASGRMIFFTHDNQSRISKIR